MQQRQSTHKPESITETSLGLWRVNVTSASRINATTPLARIGGAGVCWRIVLSSCGFRVCIVCIRGRRSGSGSGIVGRARSRAGGRLASIGQGLAEQVELSGLARQRVILRRGSGGIAPRGCLHPHAWPFA
ncbi:MAG: hypothetical protein VB124_03850 [Burkholderia sp.]